MFSLELSTPNPHMLNILLVIGPLFLFCRCGKLKIFHKSSNLCKIEALLVPVGISSVCFRAHLEGASFIP